MRRLGRPHQGGGKDLFHSPWHVWEAGSLPSGSALYCQCLGLCRFSKVKSLTS